MASIINPAVKVTLDKERTLLYGAAAFIEFKEEFGLDLMKYMRSLFEQFQKAKLGQDEDGNDIPNPDFEIPLVEFRNLLWAGLIHEDENLGLKEVSRMFTLADLQKLIPLVMEAFVAGMPKSEPDRPTKAPARNPRKLTGITSGASVAVISA